MPGPRASRLSAAALIVAAIVPLVWLGDIPFINDEPQLIANAMGANRQHQLASMGLVGTYGFVYGPAPTWVFQVLVTAGRDLVLVAVLHTLLLSAATAGALWWLSRSLRLWVWFAPVPLLSPYFWFYARVLWDNPFLIPLSAFALAGYAAHLNSGSSLGLRVSLIAMLMMPLVHLMSVALVAPLAVHMVIVCRRGLWAHRYSVGSIAVAVLLLAWPYWSYLAAAGPSPAPAAFSVLDGWLFPLYGGRLLSARALDYFYGAAPVGGRVFQLVASVSSIAYLLVWLGLAVAVVLVAQAARTRSWSPRAHVAAIVVGSLVCQAVIHGMTAKFEHPHYYNGAWISFVLLAWFAVDVLAARGRGVRWATGAATGLLASALLLAVAMLTLRLHKSHGARDFYGATLANQQQIARALAGYSNTSEVRIRVTLWERYPHTLAVLRQLNVSRRMDLPRGILEIRYASDDPASGEIELVER
jgi:hypothetical protein